nr:FprA family A-type flavoprotein [Thiopseudomonas sp.]
MRREPIVLFDNGSHQCLMFDDLVTGDGIQSNQFLITDSGESLLLDPGGDLTYTPLSMELSKCINMQDLTYIFASHQDPDIIAALDKWLLHTKAKVITSKLWARFLPHLTAGYLTVSHGISTSERVIALPDQGSVFSLGKSKLKAIPAHFLHSVGNFQLYDPTSKILFSGDMGASLLDDAQPVSNFADHISSMEGFHRRYMVSKKVTHLWANMV